MNDVYFAGYKIHQLTYPLQPHMVLFSNGVEDITVTIANDALDYMLSIIAQRYPIVGKYKTVQTVFRAIKMILMNKQPSTKPSKEDLKTSVDVIEEIKNQAARSDKEKEYNSRCAFVCKLVINGFNDNL